MKVVVAVKERRTRGGNNGLEDVGRLLIRELVEGKVSPEGSGKTKLCRKCQESVVLLRQDDDLHAISMADT